MLYPTQMFIGQHRRAITAALIIAVGFAMPIHVASEHVGGDHDYAVCHSHDHTPDAPHLEPIDCCETNRAATLHEEEPATECCTKGCQPTHGASDHHVILQRTRVLVEAPCLATFFAASDIVDSAPAQKFTTDVESPPDRHHRSTLALRGPPVA